MKPFVFFDIDGTLFDTDGAMRNAIGLFLRDHDDKFPFSASEMVDVWFEVADEHFHRYLAGELEFPEYRRVCMIELFARADHEISAEGADAKVDCYLGRYVASFRLYDDALPCLDALADYPMGIITNGDGRMQRMKIEKTGIIDRFNPIACSGDVGAAKPDPEIFVAACRQAGRRPEECVCVGDRLDADAMGSRDAGLGAVWLDRNSEQREQVGVPVIRSLSGFPEIVKGLDRERVPGRVEDE